MYRQAMQNLHAQSSKEIDGMRNLFCHFFSLYGKLLV